MQYPLVVIDLKGRKHHITVKYIVDVVQHKNHCKIITTNNIIKTNSPADEIIEILFRET